VAAAEVGHGGGEKGLGICHTNTASYKINRSTSRRTAPIVAGFEVAAPVGHGPETGPVIGAPTGIVQNVIGGPLGIDQFVHGLFDLPHKVDKKLAPLVFGIEAVEMVETQCRWPHATPRLPNRDGTPSAFAPQIGIMEVHRCNDISIMRYGYVRHAVLAKHHRSRTGGRRSNRGM
jgi:hypothetical protein